MKTIKIKTVKDGTIGDEREFDWAIVGAETGKRKDRVTPAEAWIGNLSAWVGCKGIPLFQKDNQVI